MADEETKKFLESWGVKENIVQRFEANGIVKNMIKDFTPDLIKELIPEIGPRMIFTAKWKASFQSNKRKRYGIDSRDTESITSSDSDSPSSSEFRKSNTTSADSPYAMKRQTCFIGKELYNKLQQPSVRQILNDSEEGRKIVEGYKNLFLSKEARETVLEIIISSIVNTVKGKLNKHDFCDIAKGIVEVFPKESLDLYYTSPVSVKLSRTNRSISARGKVATAYYNRRQRTNRALQACLEIKANATKTNEKQIDPSAETNESIAWLQTNQAPWDVVQMHWNATAQVRLDDIRKSGAVKVEESLKKWPILQHPKSCSLICQDFETMRLSSIVEAINHWPTFFERVRKVCSNKEKKLPRVKSLCGMLTSDSENGSEAIVQLALLSYLIPPKGRVRTKNGHWKPSMIECEQSLVVHTATVNDVSRIRDLRMGSMEKLGLTVQPYIIVVGQALNNIDTYFIAVDRILYTVSSAFEAIDTCFKIFHVLHAAYPPESDHLWYLIQRELYQFTTKYDKKAPYILEVITALNALDDSESCCVEST